MTGTPLIPPLKHLVRRLSFWSLMMAMLLFAPGCCDDAAHGSAHTKGKPSDPRHPAPAQWPAR